MEIVCISTIAIAAVMLVLLFYSLCRMAARGEAMTQALRRKDGQK